MDRSGPGPLTLRLPGQFCISSSGKCGYTEIVSTARRMMAGIGVLEVSDATFDKEVLQSEQPVLVDFWAVWCGPCKAIAPIVDDLATTYAGKLKVAKVNVDQNGATPSRYGIRGIPALLFFKGGKVADQIVGYVPREVIEEKVNRVLAEKSVLA
jgi:thioredoxin 1